MALDVRREQSICGCTLDHVVDHSEPTGKGIRRLIRYGDGISNWWKSQLIRVSEKVVSICCFHLKTEIWKITKLLFLMSIFLSAVLVSKLKM